MPNHFETRRHILEHLGDVFADHPQCAPAVAAGIARLMAHFFARQVLGQRSARWLSARRRLRFSARIQLRARGLEVLHDQLELSDFLLGLLGTAAELHAASSARSAA